MQYWKSLQKSYIKDLSNWPERSNYMEDGLDCLFFTLIIDDIVFPDGATCMAQLGGGGSQAAFGYQLVASAAAGLPRSRVGLAAGVGADLPESCRVSKCHDYMTRSCVVPLHHGVHRGSVPINELSLSQDWLRSIGVDESGLVLHPRKTPRAWQIFEEDDRRTQASG